jgi:hypothetical protein
MVELAPRASRIMKAATRSARSMEPDTAARDGIDAVDRLGDEIAELAAHLHAATYRLLVLLREFDERGGWHPGFLSCAHWFSWRTGIAPGPAREKVRVARALAGLPRISSAMERGALSYSKARALTRIATGENEADLVDVALHATAADVERIVRAWRRQDRLEEAAAERDRHDARELAMFVDDDGSFVLRARIDPEVGALLERALEAAVLALAPLHERSDDAVPRATAAQLRADAIGLIAEAALTHGATAVQSRADRFQVVVHMDAEQSVLAAGPHVVRVPAGTSERLACDASRVSMTHDADGRVLDVGRRTRTVPTAIRRALEHRDGGCRFPGCGNRFCDAHHIHHWQEGGATQLDNLVLLCRRHHRAVHEDGYRVTLQADGTVTWMAPTGRTLPEAPLLPAVRADAATQFRERHEHAGHGIHAYTAAPAWPGGRLNIDAALMTLRG